MKKWLLLAMLVLGLTTQASIAQAQTYNPMNAEKLKDEIDDFVAAQAKGYIVWQYSGDRGTGQEFANDQYSFFRNLDNGIAICEALKEKADEYAGQGFFIGVNMWDAGEARHSEAKLLDHYSYLKNECGVTVVRSFAYAGGSEGVAKNLRAAQAAGIQLILAIGDNSNGGGGMPRGAGKSWYASGWQGEYKTFLQQVVAVSANNSALYGYELANEPHCGGDESALPAYKSWGEAVGNLLRAGSPRVGYGQMASQPNSMCDSVPNGHYQQSNSAAPITIASAHYYSAEEKEQALAAAAAATSLGKLFYIGEAGWGKENLDPEDYYLYPLDGLADSDSEKMRQSLVRQGYQVQCTTPTIDLGLEEGGAIQAYKSAGFGPIRTSLSAEQIYDLTNVKVPLWRGLCTGGGGPITNPFCSLEAYWSFSNYQPSSTQNSIADAGADITSAPVYRGLTLEQQCNAKISLLNTIHTMCEKLEDPDKCALYQEIPNTEFSTRSLRSEVSSSGFSCDMMSTPEKELSGTQHAVRQALLEVPFNLDKAYRLAFLVTCTQMKEFNGVFGFLSQGNAAPKDECRVAAFKVPDIGTNKDTGELGYIDSLGYTRRILTTVDQQKVDDQAAADIRSRLDTSVPDGQSGAVNCGSSNCQEPLTKALLDIVEANGDRCERTKEDLEYEPSSQIGSSGELNSHDGTQFADGSDPTTDLFTQPEDQVAAPQKNLFNFLADVVVGADGGEKNTKTRTFLIAPIGYELKALEKGLLALLETEYAEALEAVPEGQEFFKLDGGSPTITSSRFTLPFFSLGSICTTDPSTGERVCGRQEVTAEIGATTEETEPRYPGAVFGYLTRVLQMALRGKDSPEYTYLQSCRTTEEFLTGQCSNPLSGDTEQVATNEYLNQEVVDTSDCDSYSRIGAGPSTVLMSGPACTAAQGPANIVGQPSFKYRDALNIANWRNGNDPTKLCNEQLYKYITCTFGPNPRGDGKNNRQGSRPALIAHRVNSSGEFDPQGSQTACEYVVNQATKRGVSPRLALAMWGEESGFSSSTTEATGNDFGVISVPTSRASSSIAGQLNSFLNTIKNPTYSNYLGFLLAYSGERDRSQQAPVLFCNNRQFPERIFAFYGYLAP